MKRSSARSYHHGDLANALVTVAVELVERDGVDQFSLREAATRCGVAVSAAYKHYASRQELLLAVADVGFRALGDQMAARVRAAAARGLTGTRRVEEQLVELGRAYVLFATSRPNLFRVMYGPGGARGGGRDPRPDAPSHRLTALLLGALEEVVEAYGTRATSLDANKVIAWGLVHGFSMMVIDGVWEPPSKKALHAMIDELGNAVLRSLR